MRKGFIFDSARCVRCNACNAACVLENGLGIKTRKVYTWNEDAIPELPVLNFSISCNHCENASCMKACPAGCYTRDEVTGAVLVNQENCLGCKYCAWNCPFKAPRFNRKKKVIEKCNLCYFAVSAGEMPACVNACPTGALRFGELTSENSAPEWFPVMKNPAISFASVTDKMVRTVPVNKFESIPEKRSLIRWKNSDTSLVFFSFFVTLIASIIPADVLNGVFPDKYLVIFLLLAAAMASLFHLGNTSRAWKSVINFRSSPLSREILLFIVFSVLSILSAYLELTVLLILACITGLILLLLVDNVYNHVCSSSYFHSGQTFLTSLLLISYLTASLVPFTFLVVIKLIMSVALIIKKRDMMTGIRYLRIVILLVVWTGLISGLYKPDAAMTALILTGELIDRFVFYSDFEPENIRSMINRNFRNYINE